MLLFLTGTSYFYMEWWLHSLHAYMHQTAGDIFSMAAKIPSLTGDSINLSSFGRGWSMYTRPIWYYVHFNLAFAKLNLILILFEISKMLTV